MIPQRSKRLSEKELSPVLRLPLSPAKLPKADPNLAKLPLSATLARAAMFLALSVMFLLLASLLAEFPNAKKRAA